MGSSIGIGESFLWIGINARQAGFHRRKHRVHTDLKFIKIIFERRGFIRRNVIGYAYIRNRNAGKLARQTYGLDDAVAVARYGNGHRPVRAKLADRDLIPK